MLHIRHASASARPVSRFVTSLASHLDDLRAAQALRWEVFASECGATLASSKPGLDIDPFDAFCEHLLVRDCLTGHVVGTYRILTASAARKAGGYYAQHEFDIGNLLARRGQIAEIGRSCVHGDYRGGTIVSLLWAGLHKFLTANPHDTVIGCASISLSAGHEKAAAIYRSINVRHGAPPEFAVTPHHPLTLRERADGVDVSPPALIKGYLRAGAVVCGPPAFDAVFNCADLLMMLPWQQLDSRYARHFGGSLAAATA